MQRVMPGLFTPASMNPTYAGTIDSENSLDHLAAEYYVLIKEYFFVLKKNVLDQIALRNPVVSISRIKTICICL